MSQREILFKAKRIDNGEWVEGFLGCKGAETDFEKWYIMKPAFCSNIGYPFYFTDIEVDPETVCQYTGLTDKSGNKIFEGDIIIHDTKSLIDEKRFDRGTIVFDEETAQFVRTSDEDEQKCFEIWKRLKDDYEVIGNIHDNQKHRAFEP